MAKAALKMRETTSPIPAPAGQRGSLRFTRVHGWCSTCGGSDVDGVKVHRSGRPNWLVFCDDCIARMENARG